MLKISSLAGIPANSGLMAKFTYNGGSNPGSTRYIEVLEQLHGSTKGRDLNTGDFRNFSHSLVTNAFEIVKGDFTRITFLKAREDIANNIGLVDLETLALVYSLVFKTANAVHPVHEGGYIDYLADKTFTVDGVKMTVEQLRKLLDANG